MFTDKSYRPHFWERLGFLPQAFHRTKPGSIWLHAVSVGEIASSLPLLRELRRVRPDLPIFVSTSTVAGRAAASRQLADLTTGIFYIPVDYASCIRRVLRAIRPALLVVLETEIWPNLYHETKQTGAGVVIANGRISDRTWPRYRLLKWFFCPVLSLADHLFVQSEVDLDRYASLDVPPEKLSALGNLKYDAAVCPVPIALDRTNAKHVWVSASTVGPNDKGSLTSHSVDEDDLVIDAYRKLSHEVPQLLLVIAPRQPDRFESVAAKLAEGQVPFVRRSEIKHAPHAAVPIPGVLLLDTIGELAGIYAHADVVFVGGSIAPRGGHNILEPAAAGVPIVVGPHMQNFQSILRDFVREGAIVQVSNAEELCAAVRRYLLDRKAALDLGARARHTVMQRRGVAVRLVDELWPIYFSASPELPRNIVSRLILRALARIWCLGGARKRRKGERFVRSVPRLPIPVISIGGITVGGSGKTPFARHLARTLRDRGYSPGILTRGYRRRSPANSIIVGPGESAAPALTGDEAQMFLRDGNAAVGIGSQRYQTAQLLLSQFPETAMLLLDDGFQHARIYRDLNVVLIDGLSPFGGGHVVPMGRLREPLAALRRADVFVITRAEDDLRFHALQRQLKRYNENARVFRTCLIPRSWRDYRTGAVREGLAGRRVVAFCGLGNPRNFWSTLESLGLKVVSQWTFGDHHRYKPFEIQRLAHQASIHGADLLVTTEKDCLNLPGNALRALGKVDLAWLEIDMDIENEPEFLAILQSVAPARSRL